MSDTIEETSEPTSLDDSGLGSATSVSTNFSSNGKRSPSPHSKTAVPVSAAHRRSSLANDVSAVIEKLGDVIDEEEDDDDDVIELGRAEGDSRLGRRSNEDVTTPPADASVQRSHARKRQQSTSLMTHPIKDDNLMDFHNHKLEKGQNPLDVKYNLFSMVVRHEIKRFIIYRQSW